MDRRPGGRPGTRRLVAGCCPQARPPGSVVRHRLHRDVALGQVPGLGQDALPGERRPDRPGLPVLVPQPQAALQARAGTPAAVGRRLRVGGGRRRGGRLRSGLGSRAVGPRGGEGGRRRRPPDAHARPRGCGQAARGAPRPHGRRHGGLCALAHRPGAQRHGSRAPAVLRMVGRHRCAPRQRPAAGTGRRRALGRRCGQRATRLGRAAARRDGALVDGDAGLGRAGVARRGAAGRPAGLRRVVDDHRVGAWGGRGHRPLARPRRPPHRRRASPAAAHVGARRRHGRDPAGARLRGGWAGAARGARRGLEPRRDGGPLPRRSGPPGPLRRRAGPGRRQPAYAVRRDPAGRPVRRRAGLGPQPVGAPGARRPRRPGCRRRPGRGRGGVERGAHRRHGRVAAAGPDRQPTGPRLRRAGGVAAATAHRRRRRRGGGPVSDVDTWWRAVGNGALLGTGRRAGPPLPALGPADVHPRPSEGHREESLLDAAALGWAAVRAGQGLERAGAPEAAPEDRRPVAPRRAVQLLELVLTQPPAGAQQRTALLVHWLRAADDAGCRVPHLLLPTLLALATTSRELRRPTAAVLGERGVWLAGLRAEWSWVADVAAGAGARTAAGGHRTDPIEEEWARLPSADRLAVLAEVRADDPALARQLVGGTWSTDPARDRHDHLEALRIGLGPDDEPLLEAGLDDRAGTVREIAAALLDALPGSARAARMADRLRPLVRRTGLLGRGLEVVLPGEPDPSGVRDALGKPPPRRSARGWWLEQICAGAPLGIWVELAGAEPPAVVKRLTDAQATDALAGIRRAVRARRDPEWAAALLERGWDPTIVPA